MSVAEKRIVQSGNNVTIAENVLKVYAAGQKSVGVRETASGNPCVLDYVHPTEHELDVRLSSKNQANHGDIILNSGYRDTNFTYTATEARSRFEPIACKPNTTYTLSSNLLFYSIWWLDKDKKPIDSDENVAKIYLGGKYQPYTFTTKENCEYFALTVYNTKDGEPNPFEWLQLEEGTVETPHTPYVASFGGIKMNRYGKNLVGGDTLLENGWELQEDGSYYAYYSGKVMGKVFYQGNGYVGSVTVSYDYKFANEGILGTYPYVFYTDGTNREMRPSKYVTEYTHYKWTTESSKTIDRIEWTYGTRSEPTWIKNLQLELGETETAYEPCQRTEYTADSDGIVKGVKSISPVTTLTTYTGILITAEYYLDAKSKIDDIEQTLMELGGEL